MSLQALGIGRTPASLLALEFLDSKPMRIETLAVHGGYTPDPTTKAAVPIYQTVAFCV
jgi:O-acetylhomoserine (thiol)-lyase